jgi:uncharacterized membrane protein YebE (DUF533 family)
VPLIVALHATRPRRVEVLVSIAAGALAVIVRQAAGGVRPGSVWTPASVGLMAAVAAFAGAVYLHRNKDKRLE